MADSAKRLAGPQLLTNASATIYTVPALTTATITHFHVFNQDTVAVTFTMGIGVDAAGTRLYDAYSLPPKGILSFTGMIVLAAAETLRAHGGTTNKLNITVDGVETT